MSKVQQWLVEKRASNLDNKRKVGFRRFGDKKEMWCLNLFIEPIFRIFIADNGLDIELIKRHFNDEIATSYSVLSLSFHVKPIELWVQFTTKGGVEKILSVYWRKFSVTSYENYEHRKIKEIGAFSFWLGMDRFFMEQLKKDQKYYLTIHLALKCRNLPSFSSIRSRR